jgi:hypothetical protein
MDKGVLEGRLRDSCAPLLAEDRLRQAAVDNWYILYGESLPGGN